MSLIWLPNAADLVAKGQEHPQFNISDVYQGPFPLVKDGGGDRQNIELVHAKIMKVSVSTDEHFCSIVLARTDEDGKPEFAVYCGDKQVMGEFRADGKTLAAQLRREGKIANDVCNTLEASPWVNLIPEQPQCAFFKTQERSKGARICSHTMAILHKLDISDLEQMATDLTGWKSGTKLGVAGATAGKLSEEEAAFHSAAFIQHTLLAGERGAGKTFLARAAADMHDAVYLELQCHPSMEPWEFRAHDRAWNGKVYTVLGKLAEAVWLIQQGKKVVLCMDEFFNMNPMYTTAINSPLSLTDKDTYLIETGRIIDMGDGIGVPEVAEVPADKFWVVATSNVGARYGLDKITPSVLARFFVVLMNTNPARTKSIAEKQLAKYEMPLQLADNFEKFLKAVNQAVEEGTLSEEATTRLVSNVIRAVAMKTKRDAKVPKTVKQWTDAVKKQLLLEIGQIVSFETGPYDEEQKALFVTTVEAAFA